jgi:hypothetical protein
MTSLPRSISITFETTPAGDWLATADTADGPLHAVGQTIDQARAEIERVLAEKLDSLAPVLQPRKD